MTRGKSGLPKCVGLISPVSGLTAWVDVRCCSRMCRKICVEMLRRFFVTCVLSRMSRLGVVRAAGKAVEEVGKPEEGGLFWNSPVEVNAALVR